jgi:3-hydroxy-9,10-secoandrosta-1,3,5(10)-triene-9,17-dione monooxygenase
VLGGFAPSPEPGEPPDLRTFLVPRADYAIDDNWHTVGLCGTGSKDLVVADAFVPEYRTHSYRDAFHLRNPGAAVNDGPLYRLPFGLVFPACIASPAVGVALGAVDAFREQTRTRVSPRDQSRVAEDPFVQLHLAEAAAEVAAARDRLLDDFTEMMRRVRNREELPLSDRARYRWNITKAADRSVHAVDRLFEASGGRGIFLDNPIQRAWRDVHAIRAHAGNSIEKAAAIFGRSELGLPPVDLRF